MMISHQLAAGHKRALELLADSEQTRDPDIAIKKARASARLMHAFSRSALTLQRLQNGIGQTIQVQYMHFNTMVRDAAENIHNPSCRNNVCRQSTIGRSHLKANLRSVRHEEA